MNLKAIREQKGITQTALANHLGVVRSTVCQYEKGNREPDSETLKKIAEFFNVSVDYLLGVEPKLSIDTTDTAKIKKDPAIQDEVELNDVYPIPLLGSVVAGVPIEAQEDLQGYVYINYKPKEEYFALRVHGDSMINAGIRDKSVLIVHKQAWANCGDIVVAMLNGEQTVKRLKVFGDNHNFLMPENPAYEPIPIIEGKDELIILGKVVEVRMMM